MTVCMTCANVLVKLFVKSVNGWFNYLHQHCFLNKFLNLTLLYMHLYDMSFLLLNNLLLNCLAYNLYLPTFAVYTHVKDSLDYAYIVL